MKRRSLDEGGDGENERQKDENDGEPELGLERVREERHPLLGEEDLGNKEPHARRSRQLSRTQQVQGHFLVVPGMQPRGQGGPRTPDRVRGLPRPQILCRGDADLGNKGELVKFFNSVMERRELNELN